MTALVWTYADRVLVLVELRGRGVFLLARPVGPQGFSQRWRFDIFGTVNRGEYF